MQYTGNDAKRFSVICSNQLGLNESDTFRSIVETRRVGSDESSQKTRPVIICFDSFVTKNNILKNAYKLRSFTETGSKLKVYISRDLTRKQQVQQKLLRQKLRERRDNGEKVFIRRGRIVEAPNNNNPLSSYIYSYASSNHPVNTQGSNATDPLN